MYGDLPPHGNIKIYRLCYIVSSNYLLYSSVESIKNMKFEGHYNFAYT